jgi:hypothetical protein
MNPHEPAWKLPDQFIPVRSHEHGRALSVYSFQQTHDFLGGF